jgi:hypothetical protein
MNAGKIRQDVQITHIKGGFLNDFRVLEDFWATGNIFRSRRKE